MGDWLLLLDENKVKEFYSVHTNETILDRINKFNKRKENKVVTCIKKIFSWGK